MMITYRHCIQAIVLACLLPYTAAFFVTPPCCASFVRSTRPSSSTTLSATEPGTSDDTCPGYPRCDGEYRDKGCDGTGRIAGGVGALLPWLPVKAYRPCPSFVEAKYKYSRQGQSLNEVVFARREGTMNDITMDSIGEMKEGGEPEAAEVKEGADESPKE